MGERPLEELVQSASQQVVVAAGDAARRELTARARQLGPGAAMVGGGVFLGALASATGTAALILLLARRPGASAAALGVTGAYGGAGALMAREGLARLREAGLALPDAPIQAEPARNTTQDAQRRTKSAAKSPPRPTRRPKSGSASSSARRRSSRLR